MATLTLSSADPASLPLGALVFGLGKGADGPVLAPGAEALDDALGGRLLEALVALGATGAESEVTKLATLGSTTAPVLVAAGLGATPDGGGSYRPEAIRRAAGAAARALAGAGAVGSTLALVNGQPGVEEVRAAGEGALLGSYDFTRYRTVSGKDRPAPVTSTTLVVPDARQQTYSDAVRRASVLGQAVALCRDLVNTAPNDLHPAELAEAARVAGVAAGLDVEVLDQTALQAAGYGGILGVGMGSENPPRLVRLTYSPEQPVTTVALIGKGITFDSGGLSLKPTTAMDWMKGDMAGAAAVVAAITAIAALELPVAVTAWAPLAENMPSGSAQRPGDVLTMYGGKRVEVVNTDAEGRLVLGDAIARACEDGPEHLIEVSTLTGAQIVALGHQVSGVMGSDDMRERVVRAAGRAGEGMWPMPLPLDVRRTFDSDIADFKNLGDRTGGMLAAGLFLQEFVADGVEWAHIDIAGPSFNTSAARDYTPKGGTGAAVRTLVAVVEDLAGLADGVREIPSAAASGA